MKTVYINDADETLRDRIIQGILDAPVNSAAVAYFHEQARELFLTGNPVKDNVPFAATDLTDEDGTVYETIEFAIESVYTVDGQRWATGGGFRVNLTAFYADSSEIVEEALALKVDKPTDYSLDQILGG